MNTSAPLNEPVCLTIGVFDGVHRGHQHLIRTTIEYAAARGLVPACLTFHPDPEAVLAPDRPPPALSTVEERVKLIRALGMPYVQVLEFSEVLARKSPREFLDELRARFRVRVLCVGADFALGHERMGTVDVLRELGREMGFTVEAVDLVRHQGRPISSTWIRELLAAGDVELANELLGRPYCLDGVVESGARRGQQLGFPTANVRPPTGRALPADGVYFVRASRADGAGQETWSGVVNLGARPTFEEAERLLEIHLLDFQGDLYGARLSICFLRQLRQIQKFAGVDELRAQIAQDIAVARELARSANAAEHRSPAAGAG